MANKMNSTKVVTGVVRLSYANVWEPASINGSNPKYSVSLIIPKSDKQTLDAINAAVDAAIKEGWEYIADYAGTKTTYTVQTDTTEKCEALLTDTGLEVLRVAAGQTAVIRYEELAELIDVMIYTKVIEITTIESDLKYWAARTTKELAAVSNYLTENEIYVLQDLMMKCKERAGK